MHLKKLLGADWLRAVQFKCNISAESVTPVQKVKQTPVQITTKLSEDCRRPCQSSEDYQRPNETF